MGLEGFDLGGDDVVYRYRLAGHFPALPHTKPSDDVDCIPDFQLIEVLDFFAFPRSDVMPGCFDGLATVLCEVFGFREDDEFSSLCGVNDVDGNAPESSGKIDSVQIPSSHRKKCAPPSLRTYFCIVARQKCETTRFCTSFPPAPAFLPMCPRLPGGSRGCETVQHA